MTYKFKIDDKIYIFSYQNILLLKCVKKSTYKNHLKLKNIYIVENFKEYSNISDKF